MKKLETEEEVKFVDLAFEIGCKAIKYIDPGCAGAPDRMVLCPRGQMIFFEFKRYMLGYGVTRRQSKYHKGLVKMGFRVHVAYSAADALGVLKDFLNEN